MPSRCAIWARVSTDDQDTGNQLAELRAWAGRRGLDIAAEYVVDGASAWKGQHRDRLAEALAGARTGGYDVVLVWALDRLSREGVEATLGLLRRFHAAGAPVWSLREPGPRRPTRRWPSCWRRSMPGWPGRSRRVARNGCGLGWIGAAARASRSAASPARPISGRAKAAAMWPGGNASVTRPGGVCRE
jgi:hypothetical protein